MTMMIDDDTYTVTVVFERSLSEDQSMAQRRFPGLPLPEALQLQLRDELQQACDNGLAGIFDVGAVTMPGVVHSE